MKYARRTLIAVLLIVGLAMAVLHPFLLIKKDDPNAAQKISILYWIWHTRQ